MSGCGGSDAEDAEPIPNPERSPSCHKFQRAVCDSAIRCGAEGSLAECMSIIGSVFCREDPNLPGLADVCTEQLATAKCDSQSCLYLVIDLDAAVSECNRYVDAVCAHEMSCDSTVTEEACRARLKLDCKNARGMRPGLDDCIRALANLPCTSTLPSQCEGLVTL